MADSFDTLRSALADRYRIDREIGHGATAVVLLAEDLKHRRPVALKVLRPEITALLGPERFLAEIEIAARLTHPHVLPLYDSGTAAGALYYVMPYVVGESLGDRLEREKQLPVGDAVRIAREVADALGYAHRRGVVHRDVKPENILLQEGHAVVADFGLARALTVAGGPKLTQSGVTVGTPAYMSPEQTMGDADLDGRSDLYSLGCVLYEMLAGQPPFTSPTVEALVYQHLSVPPREVTTVRPLVPPSVTAVISRALAKNPADRFRDAAEMVHALDSAAAHAASTSTGESATTPQAAVARPATTVATDAASRTRPRVTPLRAAVAVAALVTLVVVAWALRRALEHRTPAAPGAIAVLPFTVRGSDELRYLGEGMVDLLSTSLDGAAELRRVDPHALLGYLRRGGEAVTPARGREVAQHFAAPLFVLGDVMPVGRHLRLQASLYDRGRGESPIADASVEGDERDLSSMVDRLAAGLLSQYTGQRVDLGGRLTRLAAVTTSSLPALKAYLEGEHQFRDAHYVEAMNAFRRAVEIDSTFALGWFRYSVAAGWTVGPTSIELMRDAGERAVRYADRLTPRDRELLLSHEALNIGDIAEAERHAQAAVESHPDDADSWVALSETLFHGNAFRGRPPNEARPALERAVALDPEATEPLNHLIEIEAIEGHEARAESLVARFESMTGNTPDVITYRALLAVMRNDREAWPALLRQNSAAPQVTAMSTLNDVGVLMEDLPNAERIGETMAAAPAATAGWRSYVNTMIAAIRLGRGRWHSATDALRSAEAGDSVQAITSQAFLDGCGFLPLSKPEMGAARARLEAWHPPRVADTTTPDAFETRQPGAQGIARVYLIGLLSTRLGDDGKAIARAKELEATPPLRDDPRLARDLATGLRARVAWRGGHPDQALRMLEGMPITAFIGPPSGWRTRTHERELRAELLRAVGRDAEALRWYEVLYDPDMFGLPYLAPSYLRRAEIEEKLGRTDQAMLHYRRVLDLWSECDPELRSIVGEARERLARLTSVRS